jgi:hypothetical protein
MAKIRGTDGADALEGTAFDDLIRGFGGIDALFGRQGNDRLNGDIGNDVLYGNLGDDTLIGGKGWDELNGGAGADILFGGEGDDVLAGGLVNDDEGVGLGYWDNLDGGAGNDWLTCHTGAAFGGTGDDRIGSLMRGSTYAIQTGGAGADDLGGTFEINDGAIGLLHITDFTPADGDMLAMIAYDPATGAGIAASEMFGHLDTNLDGLVNDADDAARVDGARLWLNVAEDVVAIDFTGPQIPELRPEWMLG